MVTLVVSRTFTILANQISVTYFCQGTLTIKEVQF